MSAGRPGEGAAAEDVEVEVRDGFAGLFSVVDDDAEGVADPGFAGGRAGCEQEVAEEGAVFRFGGRHAGNDFFRDDQKMRGRLRFDVADGDAVFVLMDDFGGKFAVDDFGEDGLFAHGRAENGEEVLKRQGDVSSNEGEGRRCGDWVAGGSVRRGFHGRVGVKKHGTGSRAFFVRKVF